MRQVGKILMVALFATAVWTSGAKATPQFFTCEVLVAGMPTPTTVTVRMSDTAAIPTFTATWFAGSSGVAQEMLAVALTAISLGNTVLCNVDLALTPPRILNLYLRN